MMKFGRMKKMLRKGQSVRASYTNLLLQPHPQTFCSIKIHFEAIF